MVRAAAFEFIFSNHFHILFPINLWDNRILSCSLGLNQDLQDFEDFLVLGVGWDDACRSF
jgi:hypothetical protein